MKTKTFVLLFICGWTLSRAQSPILDAYIQQGLKDNLQLKQEQLNYERSMENLAQAKALFLPYIGANATYQIADGGRKINLPVGDLLNPLYIANGYPTIKNQSINFL